MKNLILTLLFLSFCPAVHAQQKEPSQPETFDMEWEGQQLTMQKYFIIFLKKGPDRDQPEDDAKQIQEKHLAYLGGLYKKVFSISTALPEMTGRSRASPFTVRRPSKKRSSWLRPIPPSKRDD